MDNYIKVDIKVVCGKNLIPMDTNGKSDPFVKIYRGKKVLHKTSVKKDTLDPSWNEQFTLGMQHETEDDKITFEVFDFDFPLGHDFMGQGYLELSSLNQRTQEVAIELEANQDKDLIKKMKKKDLKLGSIIVRVTFTAVEAQDTKENCEEPSAVRQFMSSLSSSSTSSNKLVKSEDSFEPDNMTGSVHVVLIQARGLIPTDGGDCVNSFCKLTLGSKTRKSDIYPESPNPKWREGVDLPWYQGSDNFLEITIFDFNYETHNTERIGRAHIDLATLDKDISHNVWLPIQDRVKGLNSENLLNIDKEGKLNMIITISGTNTEQEPGVLETSEGEHHECESKHLSSSDNFIERYALNKTLEDRSDVGVLKIRILRAEGLQPEYVGNRNPFVVLEIGNTRVQTCAKRSTTEPQWNKEFTLSIADICDELEVTVCDCNDADDYRFEFLGKVKISLLNIESGVGKWYTLKDKSLRSPAKGNSAKILLQMDLFFNKIRACSYFTDTKQIKYEQTNEKTFDFDKFKIIFARIMEIKDKLDCFTGKFQALIGWKDAFKSFYSLLVIPTIIWYFEPWMVPLIMLVFLLYNLANPKPADQVLEDLQKDPVQDEEEEKTIIQKWEMLQQKVMQLQEGMEKIASTCERAINLFNFTVPLLSGFLSILLLVLTLILPFIPLRLLVILWVLNKFRKGLMKIEDPTNKVLDLLSRVPDNEQLKDYSEIDENKTTSRKSLVSLRKKASEDRDII